MERYKAIISSGVDYALGTDATHGSLLSDVLFMIRNGGSPVTILQAVTINAAKVSGYEHLVGSITEGKKADIVGVKGNAKNDISVVTEPCFVLKNGNIVKNVLI